jgi:hypothetical protein
MLKYGTSSGPGPVALEREPQAGWSRLIPADQQAVLRVGTDALERAEVPFLLAGALALATYTGYWRNTKDVDVIINASDRERAVAAVRAAGFEDYHQCQAYDRSWIFRGFMHGVLFDIIWDLPNHRVVVDEKWFHRGNPLRLGARNYRVIPVEELIRVKLYVMQRERCDWVDVLNVLAATVEILDWPWLIERMGRDLPLLHSALALFNWMCPGRARELPRSVRERFALAAIEADDLEAMEVRRVRLLDSRPWFAPHQPIDRPLER